MFLQTDPLAAPEVFYGPVSRVNPRRGGRISPWCGWGIPVLRFNPHGRRTDGEGGIFGNLCPLPIRLSDLGRGRWKLKHVALDLDPWRGEVEGGQQGRGMRVESAVVFFPGFYSPSPVERRRAATRGGSGKKHLITGVSLLVTRRWQRLPWVSRFRERRVFCLEARGLLRALPRLGGRPGLSEPLSTPASAARPASLPFCGDPAVARAAGPGVLAC